MAFIKNYYNEFTDLMDKTGGKFCMQENTWKKKIFFLQLVFSSGSLSFIKHNTVFFTKVEK